MNLFFQKDAGLTFNIFSAAYPVFLRDFMAKYIYESSSALCASQLATHGIIPFIDLRHKFHERSIRIGLQFSSIKVPYYFAASRIFSISIKYPLLRSKSLPVGWPKNVTTPLLIARVILSVIASTF